MTAPDPTSLPLRDIHLPPPVGWWPPAPGWWLLAALVVLLLALLAWRWQRRRSDAVRRAALGELAAIEADIAAGRDAHACARRLSVLARQVALARGLRGAASSTGPAWLALVTESSGQPLPAASAAVLTEAPYSARRAAELGPQALRDAALAVRSLIVAPPRREPAGA